DPVLDEAGDDGVDVLRCRRPASAAEPRTPALDLVRRHSAGRQRIERRAYQGVGTPSGEEHLVPGGSGEEAGDAAVDNRRRRAGLPDDEPHHDTAAPTTAVVRHAWKASRPCGPPS